MATEFRTTEDMVFGQRPPKDDSQGIPALVSRLADGLGRLITEHIALAKVELAEDVKAMGGELARIAAFIPFVFVGYVFLCGAVAAVLAHFVGTAGGLAIVGGVHVVGGGFGLYRAAMRLKNRKLLDGSMTELTQSAQT